MTDNPSSAGSGDFTHQVEDAAASLLGIQKQGQDAADEIGKAFDRAGLSLTKSLARASSDGKLSLGELATAAIQAIDVFARSSSGASAGGGLADALGSVFKSVFSGARADGGPVGAGGAYLVGERGPELFRPNTTGEVSPLGGGGATIVNVSIQGGGAPSILRSEAQIAGALARAARLGMR